MLSVRPSTSPIGVRGVADGFQKGGGVGRARGAGAWETRGVGAGGAAITKSPYGVAWSHSVISARVGYGLRARCAGA
jgi:hypothetical protein